MANSDVVMIIIIVIILATTVITMVTDSKVNNAIARISLIAIIISVVGLWRKACGGSGESRGLWPGPFEPARSWHLVPLRDGKADDLNGVTEDITILKMSDLHRHPIRMC